MSTTTEDRVAAEVSLDEVPTPALSGKEFADYWDSITSDTEFGINFMATHIVHEGGKELLAITATVLARRHGVSSDQVKSFRTCMHKACKKAGIETHTPKKMKGTGTKLSPEPSMVLIPSTMHAKPRKSGYEQAKAMVLRGVKQGFFTLEDADLAVSELMMKDSHGDEEFL